MLVKLSRGTKVLLMTAKLPATHSSASVCRVTRAMTLEAPSTKIARAFRALDGKTAVKIYKGEGTLRALQSEDILDDVEAGVIRSTLKL
jgi:hypothetical protein